MINLKRKLPIALFGAGAIHVLAFGLYPQTNVLAVTKGSAGMNIPVVSASIMEILPLEIELPALPDMSSVENSIQSDIEAILAEEKAAELARQEAVEEAERKAAEVKKEAEQRREAEKAAAQTKQDNARANSENRSNGQNASPQSNQNTAPTQNAGTSEGAMNAYAQSVQRKIARTRQRNSGEPGRVTIAITIASSGELAAISVAQSSGNASTDQAALDHIRRAAPFGKTPNGKSVSYTVPVKIE